MSHDVVIIGAGIAGLNCARTLHRQNISSIILEAGKRAGGRIKTESVGGFLLDHGFQVLQSAYPEAAETLDFEKLDLKKFPAGVAIRCNDDFHVIADPRRHPGHLLSTLFSPVGSLKDRFLMLRLVQKVSRGSLQELLIQEEEPALTFLQAWGFSAGFIETFFRPFLAGACLDPEIDTSSHVLKYLIRVFAQGDATLPARGMGSIPEQIVNELPSGSVRYDSRVVRIEGGNVTTKDGETFHGKTIVLAIPQHQLPDLLPDLQPLPSLNEHCFYFSTDWLPPFREPFLVLNGDGDGPINNIAFPSLVASGYAPPGKTLVAAVVIGMKNIVKSVLEQQVRNQCRDWFGSQAKNWELIKTFTIEHALPIQKPPTTSPYVPVKRIGERLHIIGEYGSLPGIQWALLSGRKGAEAIITAS